MTGMVFKFRAFAWWPTRLRNGRWVWLRTIFSRCEFPEMDTRPGAVNRACHVGYDIDAIDAVIVPQKWADLQ